ncbi:MAG TPA: SDR family NAD(P)-dependent oxidoreductase, partial [bacterium]|nr:SDR family NAD(P)-dependent oxidoreductase [bacterium]
MAKPMIGIDLSNKVAVLTGAAGGIGSVIAQKLEKAGAKVYAVDMIQPPHGLWKKTDVGSFDETGRCVEEILKEASRIDILINNAGITRDAVIWKMDESDWDDVMRINLKGAFNLIHHISPAMRYQNAGRIINITSINGMRGKFGQSNYAASKAGLIALTKSVARELARHQVTANAIAPGLIGTPMVEKMP